MNAIFQLNAFNVERMPRIEWVGLNASTNYILEQSLCGETDYIMTGVMTELEDLTYCNRCLTPNSRPPPPPLWGSFLG